MKRITIITFLFINLLSTGVKAEKGHLYTSAELTSSAVTCVVQDSLGYIWVGTECGLNKFDGYTFTHFLPDDDDPASVGGSNIATLFVDTQGHLWIGSDEGLSRYDYHANSFVNYRFPLGRRPRVSSLTENARGLLIGTAGYGLYSIRKGTDTIREENKELNSIQETYFSRMFIDSEGFLWKGTHEPAASRYKLNSDNRITAEQSLSLPCGAAVRFLQKDKQTLLIVCLYGIMEYDMKTGRMSQMDYDQSKLNGKISIRNANMDSNGDIYICTSGNGLMKIDHATHSLSNVLDHENILQTANVNSMQIDKDGNIWASCYNRGLYKLENTTHYFKSWRLSERNVQTGSYLSSMTVGNDGNIWFTIKNNGLYVFDHTGRLKAHPKSPTGTGLVYCDRRGQLWTSSEKTVYKYNPSTETAQPILDFDSWGVNCMTDDGKRMLYISNFGKGLYAYDTTTGSTVNYSMKQNKEDFHSLCNDWINAMMVDTKGMLWLATTKGVSRMNTATGSMSQFKEGCLLPNSMCTSLGEDKQGNILIGTNRGLYQYSYTTDTAKLLEESRQIAGYDINAIIIDNRGDAWLSTTNGIWLYEIQAKRLLGYTHGYGLSNHEYRRCAAVNASNGHIAFGTNDGITEFNPDDVRRINISLGDVFLTDFMIGGRHADCLQERLVIPYGENAFLMKFSLLDYQNTDNITFEYRLNKKHEWTAIPEGTNTIYFNRMMPGTYLLEVRAIYNGAVSRNPKKITLVVEHPWYSTTAAYVIYLLISISIVAAVFIVYRRNKRKELEEAKMQFLINATHDIRSPLTLILGPLARLKAIVGDNAGREYIDIISHNAQRLLLLVNQILDERKIDKNQMHLHCSKTDMVGYIRCTVKSYKYRAEQRNISLTVNSQVDGLEVWIDRIHFDKVISNLLSNAFKYTPEGGEISIGISSNGKQCVITITDTGIGLKEEKPERLFERFYQSKSARDVASEGTGIGLNLSRAIVLLHRGTISAANRTDGITGSVFTVTLPIGNSHLSPEEIDNGEDTADEKKTALRQPSKNLRVMVVDDDEEIAQYIKNELSPHYRLSVFYNGREALKALLGDTRYDIVVSDVMMPQMDGISLLRAIKTNPKVSDIPVILLTSKAEVADRLEGLKRGADAFLAKPFNIEELQIQIDNLIDNLRRIKGKYSGNQDQADKVEAPKVEGNDDLLMKRIMKSMNEHLSDPDFNVERLSEEVGLSRAQLHRKMKEITGISTSEFIRNIRLEQAARLIKEGKINITQVAYAVGYNNQTHFSTMFKKQYGMSPSEFAAKFK